MFHLTSNKMASPARNFGKLESRRALIKTISSFLSGFCRLRDPAITSTLLTALYENCYNKELLKTTRNVSAFIYYTQEMGIQK